MFREANVTVFAADFEKSLRFYKDTLGLRLGFRNGNRWAEVSTGGLTIGITPRGDEKLSCGDSVSIGFNVDSLEAEMDRLKKKEVVFGSEIVDRGIARVVPFTDPDNNPLYLCELKKALI